MWNSRRVSDFYHPSCNTIILQRSHYRPLRGEASWTPEAKHNVIGIMNIATTWCFLARAKNIVLESLKIPWFIAFLGNDHNHAAGKILKCVCPADGHRAMAAMLEHRHVCPPCSMQHENVLSRCEGGISIVLWGRRFSHCFLNYWAKP